MITRGGGLSSGQETIVIATVIVVRTAQELQKAMFPIVLAIFLPPQFALFEI